MAECHAERLPNIILSDGETSGALGPVNGFDLEGIISFDQALRRAWEEDGKSDAKTVQVVLGSADADELHWGHGEGLYYGIEWGGLCFVGSRPVNYSPPPGGMPCDATDWGTVIGARTGRFVVGGT